jgi:chorismate-pyruvate lyase
MPKRSRAVTRRPSARSSAILHPLDLVYTWSGIELPKAMIISPYDVPLPYRSLLVHDNDMTMMLEQHFGGRIGLRVLWTLSKSGWYYRRVLLVQEYSGRPVEMGAIRIKLDQFSQRIRGQILRNRVPIGRVLRDGGVDFRSQAKIFLKVTPNAEMMGVFWMREPRPLYGRQTEIIHDGHKAVDIVEVLPPV